MTQQLRIATRKSALALWQARHVRDLLVHRHPDLAVELVPMVTRGDRIIDRPLASVGGKGLFLKELETALLAGEADIAVHSMKDVPADCEPALQIAAILPRADHRDALVSTEAQSLQDLPAGARVGTSSLRRQCQLAALRPDLERLDLRGNVDTRLSKLDQGDYDAIILASAGLIRLGLAERIAAPLAGPDWLSAPAQGAIGIQCRTADAATCELIEDLNDTRSALTVGAERHFARRLEGSCQVPLAALAELDQGALTLRGLVGTPDGNCILRGECTGAAEQAAGLADALADELLERGAGDILRRLSP